MILVDNLKVEIRENKIFKIDFEIAKKVYCVAGDSRP